ncbi:MAG: hypothetical protein C0507_08245 [Cyanobacteria bacterium PR.3.49]|nr:hypothetical protein [Cyanobacteria bacterium PR.3.49]
MNFPQTILKYWQSRTYEPVPNQDEAPILRVKMHSSESGEHNHDLRDSQDKQVCDCGRSPKQFQSIRSVLTESTTCRVNLDWLPDNLLYE